MAIFPKDYKLKVVDITNKNTSKALGFTDGDDLDMRKQLSKHMYKLRRINTRAEEAVYLQNEMPHYMLAILCSALLKESMERFNEQMKDESPLDKLNELVSMIEALSKLSSNDDKHSDKDSNDNNDNNDSDDDCDCSSCDRKDECSNFIKELKRMLGV